MHRIDFLWMFLIAFCLLIFFRLVHGPITFEPNKYIFQNYGDGLRNHFVTADHVRNDSSILSIVQGLIIHMEIILFILMVCHYSPIQ